MTWAKLSAMLELLQREKALLEERLDEYESMASGADTERKELVERNEALQAVSQAMRDALPALEKRALALTKSFPEPLTKEITPLINRIPTDPGSAKISPSQRLQSVVGILSQAEKFNSGVSLITEIKTLDDGKTTEVETLYFGLAGAVFSDIPGSYAGVGIPGPEGWQWESRPETSKQVRQLIDIYQNTREATFTEIPVTIR